MVQVCEEPRRVSLCSESWAWLASACMSSYCSVCMPGTGTTPLLDADADAEADADADPTSPPLPTSPKTETPPPPPPQPSLLPCNRHGHRAHRRCRRLR